MRYQEFGIYSNGNTIFVVTEIINKHVLGFYIPQWDIEEFSNSFVRNYLRNNYRNIQTGYLSVRDLEETNIRILKTLGYLGKIEEDKTIQGHINNLFQEAKSAGWKFNLN